jgi:hypothetical protein
MFIMQAEEVQVYLGPQVKLHLIQVLQREAALEVKVVEAVDHYMGLR